MNLLSLSVTVSKLRLFFSASALAFARRVADTESLDGDLVVVCAFNMAQGLPNLSLEDAMNLAWIAGSQIPWGVASVAMAAALSP